MSRYEKKQIFLGAKLSGMLSCYLLSWSFAPRTKLVDDPEKKKYCYQKVLGIEPQNQYALRGVAMLNPQKPAPIHSSSPVVPVAEQNRPQMRTKYTQKNNLQSVGQYQIRSSHVKPAKEKKRISTWTVLGLALFVSYAILFPVSAFINSKGLGEFAMMLGFGWLFHYMISGYVGAYKMIKNGKILQLVGCSILLGGLPLLLPAVLGYFLLWWANRDEKQKNK